MSTPPPAAVPTPPARWRFGRLFLGLSLLANLGLAGLAGYLAVRPIWPDDADDLAERHYVGTKTAAEIREVVKGANIQEGKKLKAEGKKDPLEKRTAARQERAKRENAAKDAAKGVTTFVLEGSRVTAKLYRENKDADGKLIQASSVTDAWGWIDGKNGVQLVFRLEKNEDGRLKIVFRAKREESEEVER